MKVALVMMVVGDLHGSGGTERLFSHLHGYLASRPNAPVSTLITATSSLRRLQAAGFLSEPAAVVALDLGANPARGKTATAWMTLRLFARTLGRGFDVVHLCQPTPSYVPFAAVVGLLPRAMRPKLTLTIIDCTLASSLAQEPPPGTYERQVLDAHRLYFQWARLDGIYSWYQSMVDLMARRRLTRLGRPLVKAARFCFTDPDRFQPAAGKENVVVFAGRLSDQKRPLMFVDAVALVRAQAPHVIEGWRFEMYGTGVMERVVRDRIETHRLGDLLTTTHAADMSPVFARSRLFVSTQAFENFTSLALLEAMAAGNAVIAANVGQTAEFVRHGENGLLTADESAQGFADAMTQYLGHPERHPRMAACSRALATEVHTIEHFAEDIRAFWEGVLQ